MKRNIGSKLALYPMPVTVIGAMNDDKPTWTLVAHIGIIGHDRVLVSLAAPHFINKFIKENNSLSINIVDENILALADYSGKVSGSKEDKSNLFEYEIGEGKTPVIKKSPLVMECKVVDIYNTPNFENFICSIENTYVEENCLDENDKIDYNILKPVLFEFPTYQYLRCGEVIGKCLSFAEKAKVN